MGKKKYSRSGQCLWVNLSLRCGLPWVPFINNKTLQETLTTTLTYQNIGLEGNTQLKPLALGYIGLVNVFCLSVDDISPSQTGALLSCSSLPVALLSSPLAFLPILFLKSLQTPLSLSPLISIYIVLLHPTNVSSVTSICLFVCQAAVQWHWNTSRRRRGKTRGWGWKDQD